ncbi:DUF420 domain-containing protein [Flavobacteriaceae bacterium F08102]|nr:DUF420 domain-containing protein [Flavobacteriaceae bacterium F08102]
MNSTPEKKYNKLIVVLSIFIPLVVASLFSVRIELALPVFLPPIYASINAITAIILMVAFWAVKNKKVNLHKNLMKTAIFCSLVFLIMYILYHMTSDSTPFGGDGAVKYVYYFVLISHIILSIAVIPFVLITYVRAITNDIVRHKRIAKIAFPLWLYVAISGVVVYLMISPYYL